MKIGGIEINLGNAKMSAEEVIFIIVSIIVLVASIFALRFIFRLLGSRKRKIRELGFANHTYKITGHKEVILNDERQQFLVSGLTAGSIQIYDYDSVEEVRYTCIGGPNGDTLNIYIHLVGRPDPIDVTMGCPAGRSMDTGETIIRRLMHHFNR